MAMGILPRIPIRKTNIYSLKDVFGMLFKVTEYKEGVVGGNFLYSVDVSNIGYNNSGDIDEYEDDYIILDFEIGTGTTHPKYYTEGGLRLYDGNTIRLRTKDKVYLETLVFYSTSSYTPLLTYLRGTEGIEIDVDTNNAKCVIEVDKTNIDVTYVVTNSSGRYTQSRIRSFQNSGETSTTETTIVAEYDDEVGNTYPISKVVRDVFANNERVLRHTARVDDLFDLLYQAYNLWGIFKISSKSVNDPSEDEVREKFKEWLGKFCYRFDLTYYRYDTLLTLYENEEGDLLKQISTTTSIDVAQETHQQGEQEANNDSYSENRYNDTPQIENDGSLEDDPYLSQFSKTNGNTKGTSSNKADATGKSVTSQVVSTDKDTLINRLDDIQKKIRNLWGDWCDEFSKLFFYD